VDNKTIIQPSPSGSVGRGVRLNGMYEIESLLANGGMGEVYKGYNIQTRDPVAIKMILPALSRNPDVLALFRREASTLFNLQHEAIVRYFGFSVDPDLDRAYLAMEFVDGPSLANRLRQGPLSLAETRILQQRLASALDVAHRAGVIHRDISSDNVILPGGDVTRAKIIDFGIARSQRPGEGTIIGGGVAGKFNYMSPEQLGLAGGEVTAKSDIYSLGLVLAEALRGSPIDMNGTQVEIIEKRRKVPDLAGVDPSMRPLLSAMLAPLPADRPASMAAVAAWTAPTPSHKGLPPPARRAPDEATGRGRSLVVVGLIVLALAAAGAAFVFRDALLPSGATDVAQTAGAAHKPPDLGPLNVGPTAVGSAAPSGGVANPPAIETHPDVQAPVTSGGPSADKPGLSVDKIINTFAKDTTKAPPDAPVVVAGSQPASEPPVKPAEIAPSKPDAKASGASTSTMPPPRPPIAPQSQIALADATAGKDYAAELPPFRDAAGGGLSLRVEGALPEGLTFANLGSGAGRISGRPARPGRYAFDVVAANPDGTARMTTQLSVAPPPTPPPPPLAPPRASQDQVLIDDLVEGKDYVADLPPFSDATGGKGLALRADPPPPEGLSFADLGSGLGRISGRPTRAGRFDFAVVASNAGGDARMMARLVVAPPPAPPPLASTDGAQVVKATDGVEAAKNFVSGFDGGPCFFAHLREPASSSLSIDGVGADKDAFQRFYDSFMRVVRVEPTMIVNLIARPQCPAVGLIAAGQADGASAPTITLGSTDIATGKPLTGSVAGIAGRHLDLLAIFSDGQSIRIETAQSGDKATFSLPLRPIPGARGVPQILVAIASDRPLKALAGFRPGVAAATILPTVADEIYERRAGLGVEFFEFAN
jgi:predicted Ser/Thr protein kinase